MGRLQREEPHNSSCTQQHRLGHVVFLRDLNTYHTVYIFTHIIRRTSCPLGVVLLRVICVSAALK
jgi:hypothetical protein